MNESNQKRSPYSFEWDRLACFALGTLFLALVQMAWPLAKEWWRPSSGKLRVAARAVSLTNYFHTRETAAGTFDYIRLSLSERQDLLPDTRVPLPEPRWFFAGHTAAQLKRLFRTSNLSEEQRTWLMDIGHWEPTRDGIYVKPPADLVAELSRLARGQIYGVLAESPVNVAQHQPFRFPMYGLELRMADAGLTTNTMEVLRGLVYAHDGTLCFADGVIAQRLLSTDEFNGLIRALFQEPTFLMRLKVTSETDISQLMSYWGKCERVRRLRPMLESLAQVPGGGTVNVEFLLPMFVRQRLYTHPPASPDAARARQNCFWTALNFFNDEPDARFLDGPTVLRALNTDYCEVDGARELGDLICLLDRKSRPVHMCVYIADDVVFTKNGYDDRQAWVLMKIPDMHVEYPADPPLKMVTLRRKQP